MDGWRLIIESADPAERLAAVAVTVKATEMRQKLDPWIDTKGG